MITYILAIGTCLVTIDAHFSGRQTLEDRVDVLLTTGPFRNWLSYRFPPLSNDEMIDVIALRNQLRQLQLEHGYVGNRDIGSVSAEPGSLAKEDKIKLILVDGVEMAVRILDSTGAVHIAMVVPIINGNWRNLPLCSTGFRIIDRALRDVFPDNLNNQTGPIVLSSLSETRYPVYFVLCREGFLEPTLRWFLGIPSKISQVSPPSMEILMDG